MKVQKPRAIVWRVVRSDKDKSVSRYHWEIVGKNGKILATSPFFVRKRDAFATLRAVRTAKVSFYHVCEY